MFEILFRGKPKYKKDIEFVRPDVIKDDGFIYGSLVAANDKWFICTYAVCSHKTFVDNTRATMFEVISETIGRFTSSTDKNEVKIFEGDIVKAFTRYDTPHTNVITFRNGTFWFGNWNWIEFLDRFRNVEVVGNIHDNPELLKSGE